MKTITNKVLAGGWFMLFAATLIMAAAGATYMFGLYSGDIKSSLGYDQTTLNLLSFFKDLGSNFGIIAGLINEVTPPWVVLTIGAASNFTGYLMIWLAVTGRTNKPKVWQMCLYICMGSTSQSFANTGALITAVKNFPESRGAVLGLLKGFVGLSGAIFTQLYHAFFGHDSKSLILLIGLLPPIISLTFLKTIRYIKVIHQPNEMKTFYKLLYISLGLGGFLMVIIILQNKLDFNKFEFCLSALFVIFFLLSPIFVVTKQDSNLADTSTAKQLVNDVKARNLPEILSNSETETVSLQEIPSSLKNISSTIILTNDSFIRKMLHRPERGEDYTIFQALFSTDMLILFVAATFGAGGTLTAIDNLGQIGDSLGYPKESITTFISLVSIWNYLGRVFSGFLSEFLLKRYRIPRPLMLTFILLLSCCGHLLIAFGVRNSLYISSMIIGFCFGAQWPLIFAIVSEIFGLKYFSTISNTGAGASPVGTYGLNVRIAGHFYDREALKQMAANGIARKAGEELTCTGVTCYKISFLIITAVTFFGCIVLFILVFRTRKYYRSDIYQKFREDEEIYRDGGNVFVVPPSLPLPSPPPSPPPPPPPVPLEI